MGFMNWLLGREEDPKTVARRTLNHWYGSIIKCCDCGLARKVRSVRGIPNCPRCNSDDFFVLDAQND
jgi:hypothetical protein